MFLKGFFKKAFKKRFCKNIFSRKRERRVLVVWVNIPGKSCSIVEGAFRPTAKIRRIDFKGFYVDFDGFWAGRV